MINKCVQLIQKLKIPNQFKYIFLLYVALVLFFTFFRLLFQVSFSEQFYANATTLQIIKSYLIGFRFDQIIILALLTPFLLILPWFDFQNRKLKIIVSTFSYLIFPIIFLGMIADIRFYEYFNIRLNFMAYEYIGGEGVNNKFVNADRLFWEFMTIWFFASTLFVYLHHKLINLFTSNQSTKLTHKLAWFFCFLILFAGGIRGRLSLAPMDWGVAYFSNNHTLNQSALNGIYTLFRNYTETEHDPRLSFLDESERFPFISQDSAFSIVQQMLVQNNSGIHEKNSIKRNFDSPNKFDFQPNIMIILMESWSGSKTSSLGDNRKLTPHFDSLTEHGILFNKFYSNGFRTNFGLASTLCSYPAIPGRSILKRYESKHPFVSISEILHAQEYYNIFCYGGDFAFDNMEGFFRSKKYDTFAGEETFSSDKSFSKWGVPDELLFQKINQLVDSLPRPFQLTTLTLSNHEPFDIPDSSTIRFLDNSFTSQKANAIVYADYAIGKFMETMRTKPIFDSTIFLFVSDHALFQSSKMTMDPNLFQIPFLIYSPTLLGDSARIVDKVGSQVDIVPTLLGLLGGQYQTESWGRDLLNLPKDDSGFAVVNLWDRIGYINQNYFYFEQVGQYTKLYNYINKEYKEADTLLNATALFEIRQRLRAYTQLADQLTLQK